MRQAGCTQPFLTHPRRRRASALQLHVLRALASKAAAAGSMRLYDPMVRLPREQYQRHADAADGNETSAKAVLQAGPSTPRECEWVGQVAWIDGRFDPGRYPKGQVFRSERFVIH